MQMAQIAHVNLHELGRTLYFNSCLHGDFSLARRCIIASETAAPYLQSERERRVHAHTQRRTDIKAPLLLFDVIDAHSLYTLCSHFDAVPLLL